MKDNKRKKRAQKKLEAEAECAPAPEKFTKKDFVKALEKVSRKVKP